MKGSESGRAARGVNRIANALIGLAVVFAAFHPRGVIRMWVQGVWARAHRAHELRALWPEAVSGRSRLGATEAAGRTVVEFADYECPYCRRQHAIFDSILTQDSTVSLVFRHYPLQSHPHARGAALAAICAERVGRFPQMHGHLMLTDDWLRRRDWGQEALAAGIADTTRFLACLSDTVTSRRLEADVGLANQVGIRGTPSILLEGRLYSGIMPAEQIRALLLR